MTQTYHFWSKLMYVRDAQTSTVHKYHVLKSSVVRQVDKEMGFICTAVTHTHKYHHLLENGFNWR